MKKGCNMKQKFNVDEQEDTGKIQIKSTPIVTHHEVKIFCDFEDAEWANPVVELLNNSTEMDYVSFRLDSSGGDVHGTIPILSGIENTQANTHAVIEGTGVSSAASFVALKCDTLEVASKYAKMMIHGMQVGLDQYSPIGHMVTSLENMKALSDTLLDECLGFLTEEEIKLAKNGIDLYFNANEIEERWKRFKPSVTVDE